MTDEERQDYNAILALGQAARNIAGAPLVLEWGEHLSALNTIGSGVILQGPAFPTETRKKLNLIAQQIGAIVAKYPAAKRIVLFRWPASSAATVPDPPPVIPPSSCPICEGYFLYA